MRAWLAVLAVVVLVVGSLGSAVASPSNAPLAAPTPTGAHPATIYSVRNLDTQALTVKHTIRNSGGGLVYEFTDTLQIGQTHEFHVSQMSQIPTPFLGSVDIVVEDYLTDPPIEALVTGYDYLPFTTSLPIIRK